MANKDIITSIRQSIGTVKKGFENIASQQSNGMVWEKESAFAMQSIVTNKRLQECPLDSIRAAVVNVASVGLSLNPAEKLAYLVPRDGRAYLDISYRGLVKIATDSGSILWAKAMLVFENDEFEFMGVDEKPIHKFEAFAKEDERGGLVGGYSVAKLHNGDYLVDTMTADEIRDIRDRSPSFKFGKPGRKGPWESDFSEMAKKTLLRRGSKSWPTSQRFMEAEAILNEHQGIEIHQPQEVEAVRVINESQLEELTTMVNEAKLNPTRILKAFEIEKLDDLPEKDYEECKARLDKAVKAHQKKEAEKADE